METNTIDEADVKQVADSLKLKVTATQIQEVIEMYPFEQEQDPTGNWSEVVEHCIYQTST